jgi:hypothetical protein
VARPCVSLTEPSNSRAKNPYMRVPETPPNALGRGSRFANDTAAGWSTAVSSARNTIETIFCLRRNHISFPLLNTSSQRVTNRQRVAEKEQTNEKMRPMSRKTRIRCPLT